LRGRLEIGTFAALLVVACVAAGGVPAAGLAVAPRAAGGTSCAYAPADHTLGISAADRKVVVSVQRQKEELVVRKDRDRVPCGGSEPTVANVDRIVVFSKTELALDLRGGPLAPGFTNEGDGSSEIEVEAVFNRTGGLRVRGSGRRDAIVMGELAGVHGVNLNAREAHRDVDVTVDGGFPVLSVLGRAGNDLISARGGAGFRGPLGIRTTVSAGGGRDRVRGSSKRDLIGGGDGPDRIAPGAGTDRIKSLGGADRLRLRDGERDYARCGPGEDKVKADRKDRLAGCDQR
jgi:hypothetical protein